MVAGCVGVGSWLDCVCSGGLCLPDWPHTCVCSCARLTVSPSSFACVAVGADGVLGGVSFLSYCAKRPHEGCVCAHRPDVSCLHVAVCTSSACAVGHTVY